MLNFLILFLVLIFLVYLINYFLSRSFLGYKWRIFVAPGVIFHELSHALACILCFAKIQKISFFDKEGGSVTYQKSPIPVFGPIVISTAPLILGILAFYFLARQIQLINPIDFSMIFFNLKLILKTVDFSNWRNIVIIYLLMSVVVTMTPSWTDIINMLYPVAIVILISYLLVRLTALNLASFDFVFLKLSSVLTIAVFCLSGLLLLSLLLYVLSVFPHYFKVL